MAFQMRTTHLHVTKKTSKSFKIQNGTFNGTPLQNLFFKNEGFYHHFALGRVSFKIFIDFAEGFCCYGCSFLNVNDLVM